MKKVRVAINGYGRIGRNILRALYEGQHRETIEIVAINDLGTPQINAHLTQYDTTHGKFPGEISHGASHISICGDAIPMYSYKDPNKLPWGKHAVDIVLECTGIFSSREAASQHLTAGASKVIISAPATNQVDATIVFGINHKTLRSTDSVISNASCTTNCLAMLVAPLHQYLGIESGCMNTVHAYTNDQVLTDVQHSDFRRARSATMSMIPTKTGAAAAVGLVIPSLLGKIDGFAVRVPTINVSLVDFTFFSSRETTVDEVGEILRRASLSHLSGLLECCNLPLVSSDFNHNAASAIVDMELTKVIEKRLVKVAAWYDNEWGFSNRMLDTTLALFQTAL